MKTAAIFFADGFEEVEAITPLDYLRRAGVNVTTVLIPSPTTQEADLVVSSHKLPVITDTSLEEYLKEAEDNLPDCVICPGGSVGAQNLAACEKLLKHLEKCYAKGKLVAAICASPVVVLGKTNILKDKKWTCYPDMQGEADKNYLSGYSDKTFITDGNLVTSRGAGAAEEFAMELVRILTDEATAKKIHDGTLQR